MMDLLPMLLMGGLWIAGALGARFVEQLRDQRMHDELVLLFPFYRALTDKRRAAFRSRVKRFLEEKEFHGRGIEVTRDMRVMVAASAVQLTFGLPSLALVHFTRIIVYPDKYRSRISRTDHIGEVNPGMKAIVISWKHFREDYAVPDDARNLGLHEMAHALWFENRIPNEEHGFLDDTLMARWRELAREEAGRIQRGQGRLFRNYAATNQEEFFAVAVEYFFEQPRQFHRSMPDLYQVMRDLLGQDPAHDEPGLAGRP